jgi:AraC-like DNA-binding protein
MDVLSDVLAAIRLKGAVFLDVNAGTPWVGETPAGDIIAPAVMPDAEHIIMFHLIMSGACWAELSTGATGPPVYLTAGDVLVIPKGQQHVMSSEPGMHDIPNLTLYRRPVDQPLPFTIRHGGEGDVRTRFVCGYLGCDTRPFNPLLSALPDLMCVRPPEGGGWVTDLFRIALAERDRYRAGSETILSKLSELMFVEIVRRHIESLPEDSRGWLAGLRDPHIGEALKLLHGRPKEAWTLDGLARDVGLSRTTFADRFVHYVGMPPMQYLARWRMQLAARRLEVPGVSIAQVAAEVGYESEAAFNRAFKKLIGVTPGAWRKGQQRAAAAA